MEPFYSVALREARSHKAHTSAENLILSAPINICEAVLVGKCTANFKEIHSSNNTIFKKNKKILNNINAQLLERLKQAYFAI